MKDLIKLDNRKIFITGASSGIGRETAKVLADLGANCVMAARREDELKKTLSLLNGDGHSYYVLALAEIEKLAQRIKEITGKEGPFDGYVHCAGLVNDRPLLYTKYDIAHKIMSVNYFAYLEITRCLTKRGCYNPGFSIVGISSISAKTCRPSQTAYSASKAAMDAMMKCLALELSSKGIRINNIAPGMIATEMYAEYKQKYGYDETHLKREGRLGVGEPKDIAFMVAYLLSDTAKFITRSCIEISGGGH